VNKVWEVRDPKECWKSILKSEFSFRHKVLGWIMVQKGLVVNIGLQKYGAINVTKSIFMGEINS
jgi:hypothetical protein